MGGSAEQGDRPGPVAALYVSKSDGELRQCPPEWSLGFGRLLPDRLEHLVCREGPVLGQQPLRLT
jgi:hypothetical protein